MRAALDLAAASDDRLAGASLTLLPSAEGGANFVARARANGGTFYVKLRAEPRDSADHEIWALRLLAGRSAPALVGATSARSVIAEVARSDIRRLRAIDSPGGALLILEGRPGRKRDPLSEEDIARAAETLARLHRIRVRRGPPLLGGATAPAMVRYTKECLDLLASERAFNARVARKLERRMRDVQRRVDEAWWETDETSRSLCHGDVRAANLLHDRDGVSLIDFEHAGLADPLVDLARFAAFNPLTRHEELCLLDAYAEATKAEGLDRYFIYREAAPAFSAISAAHHLHGLLSGRRVAVDESYVDRRKNIVEARLSELLGEEVRLSAAPRGARPRYRGVVAIDGAAGSGKTPIASSLARSLGVPHYNTGAAYRAAALLALEASLSAERPRDVGRLLDRLARAKLDLTGDGAVQVDGRVLRASLDVLEVEQTVALWARLPEIRRALLPALGPALRAKSAVIEGRDVKSALRPDATAFYVDVDAATQRTLVSGRAGADDSKLLRAMAARERLDRTRAVAPAGAARGAVRVQGGADIEAIVAKILRRLVRSR